MITANITSKGISFDNFGNWREFYANATTPGGSDIRYYITDTYTGDTLCTIEAEDAPQGYDIRECAGISKSLKLHAALNTITFSRTPILDYWKITYETDIKNLELDIGIGQAPQYRKDFFRGTAEISDENTSPKITDVLNTLPENAHAEGAVPQQTTNAGSQ